MKPLSPTKPAHTPLSFQEASPYEKPMFYPPRGSDAKSG